MIIFRQIISGLIIKSNARNSSRADVFEKPLSEAELKQPSAWRDGAQPPEEYIPDSLTVIGNWQSEKLFR
ncbi:MAG: hypothetical protein Q7U36_00960 [bacterium]|nr:hypothetical protein [bacterium]